MSATGICVAQSFSRFYGYSLYGNDFGIQHTISSEAACAAYCEVTSTGTSPTSFVYQATTTSCLCKASTFSTYAGLIQAAGYASNLIGLCSDNIPSNGKFYQTLLITLKADHISQQDSLLHMPVKMLFTHLVDV